MPRIIVQSISSRSVELKRELARRLSDVVVDVYRESSLGTGEEA